MMRVLRRRMLAGLAALVSAGALAQDVTGAGATFPAPLYAQWADRYHAATGVRVNYQSVGSGAGMRQMRARTIDFGATDRPLAPDELARQGLVQFPTVIGGVVPVVNLRGVQPGQLRLTGALLGDIYLGKIRRWNDAALAALNPGLALPDAAISVVRRADGAGTTFLFTNYLSKVNADWKARVGEGTAVSWPTGAGGKGNEGVAGYVRRLPQSIGYVEAAYAKQNRMTTVLLRNRDGRFVAPGDASLQAAATGADWSRSLQPVLTDQPGPDAWPLTGATFIVMARSPDRPAQAALALRFFDWAFAGGDAAAAALDYVALPDRAKQRVRQLWSAIRDASGQPVAFR